MGCKTLKRQGSESELELLSVLFEIALSQYQNCVPQKKKGFISPHQVSMLVFFNFFVSIQIINI